MKRSVIETVLGALVLVCAGLFLAFSYNTANLKKIAGYEIVAAFNGIGGLSIGDQVQISGVKVGSVRRVTLDPDTYLALVTMDIASGVALPDDTTALISSESLMGGRYMELQPGASDEMLEPGARIMYTQSPQNLEQLLGKFIFSMQSGDDKADAAVMAQGAAANEGGLGDDATP